MRASRSAEPRSPRALWVWLHRWVGLSLAGFLILVGLTGALLAFLPELDHWLTPELYPGPRTGVELDAAALARQAERLVPQARATNVNFSARGTAQIGLEARDDSAPLGADILYLDAEMGAELGRRTSGAWPVTIVAFMPFIYSLHYALAMDSVGEWIMGIVALVWTIDCFVGFYLTLPTESRGSGFFARWHRSWRIKSGASFFRFNFDLHRAAGLWLWMMLFVFAWSGVYMNLNGVYTRVTGLLFDYEQAYWARADLSAMKKDALPLDWEEAQAVGRRLMSDLAQKYDFTVERPIALSITPEKGYCEYRVRSSRDIGDKSGLTWVYFDVATGAQLSANVPTGRRAGESLTTWLVELHTANLFGLPYKIFVGFFGLSVALLSVTGVYIWWKKRAARRFHDARAGERMTLTASAQRDERGGVA